MACWHTASKNEQAQRKKCDDWLVGDGSGSIGIKAREWIGTLERDAEDVVATTAVDAERDDEDEVVMLVVVDEMEEVSSSGLSQDFLDAATVAMGSVMRDAMDEGILSLMTSTHSLGKNPTWNKSPIVKKYRYWNISNEQLMHNS